MKKLEPINKRPKLPPWIRVRVGCGGGRDEVDKILSKNRLATVCQSAQCPNLGECWHRKSATFMIMGEFCTRNCRFCAVAHKPEPPPLESDEPERLAKAAQEMGLKYVVVTSVTRDDLPDGGAAHFAAVVRALRSTIKDVKIEVLTPDFNCDLDALRTVLDAKPDIFNHNVETVERISSELRDKANYRRSMRALSAAVAIGGGDIPVKSGLMVGLGETDQEVETTIRELRDIGVSVLTIGQYLPPSSAHWPVKRYVHPDQFEHWRLLAQALGYSFVASAPLVRSSYNAQEAYEELER